MEVEGRIIERLCKPCFEEENNVTADGLCEQCEEYMCKTCFKHHLKGKFCKHHTFVNNERTTKTILQQNVQLCVAHQERIKLHCRQHTAVGCAECMVLEHKACQLEYIKDVAKNSKECEEFKEMLRELNSLDTDRLINVQHIKGAYAKCHEIYAIAREEISRFRQELTDIIKEAEARILDVVNKRETDTETQLNNIEEKNKTSELEIELAKQMFNEDTYSETELFICSFSLKQKLSSIRTNLSDIEAKTVVEDVVFCKDSTLKHAIDRLKTLGSIVAKECSGDYHLLVRGLPFERTVNVWVKSSDTIHTIKEKIHDECGVSIDDQILLQEFTGKTLMDAATVQDYGFRDGSDLLLKCKIPTQPQRQDKK